MAGAAIFPEIEVHTVGGVGDHGTHVLQRGSDTERIAAVQRDEIANLDRGHLQSCSTLAAALCLFALGRGSILTAASHTTPFC
jgi:hypothetical protein